MITERTVDGLHVMHAFTSNDNDDSYTVINETDVPTVQVLQEVGRQSPEIAALNDALVTWTTSTGAGNGRNRAGGLADRDRYLSADNAFAEMRVAKHAAFDDVVASFLDSSEALAFSRMLIEAADEDEMDIWAQIMQDIDIDNRMREIWYSLNVFSQAYCAVWFGKKDYKVRGKGSSGTRRKKTFNNLTVPLGVTVMDPLKIVPVGNFLFQQETLTYYADPTERDVIDSWLLGDDDSGADEIIKRLILAKYEPDFRDRKEIGNLGVDPNRLYVLNPKYVWRHTTTKPGYERFAPLRMKGVFELLDLKQQLKEMDRAHLIGATNYIVLIKKGTDKEPAKQFEIAALQSTARNLAKIPIIVGDHRLNVEIITPKTDNTLDGDRYTNLDLRISGRLYGMFISTHAGRDDSLKLARVVARGLETRRMMQKRAFMKNVIMPTYELNAALTEEPDLLFYPKRIALDFDPSLATYLLDLRDRGDLSRDSVLSEIDYDEADEAAKRKLEKLKYDDIFTPPIAQMPGAQTAPNMAPKPKPAAAGPPPGAPNDPKRAGRAQGGNHGRGGNGNIGRGAGQEAKPAPGKGINSKPRITKPSPNNSGATDND